MMDEMEYMNIDFREERKLKKSLCTRFAHEIMSVASTHKEKKEKKELGLRLISMQMASMIQETFYKVQKNQTILITPAIAVYIKNYVNKHGFETQLTKVNINKIKKQYEEFLKNNSKIKGEAPAETEDVKMQEEEKQPPKEEHQPEPPRWRRNHKYNLMNIKDENLESLTMLTSEKIKIEDFNAVDDEMQLETKSVDYYYPKRLEEVPSLTEIDNSDEKKQKNIGKHFILHFNETDFGHIDLELLHSFFPANGVSDAIEDAKTFLIAHKFVKDESEIEVLRGPFVEYEKQVIENEEFGNIYGSDEEIVFMNEEVDEEFNEIADLLPPKIDYPENSDQKPANQAAEPQRKPEDRLPYEKPSRDVPILLEVDPKVDKSFDELYEETFGSTTEDDNERKSRKRKRDDIDEEMIQLNLDDDDIEMKSEDVESTTSKMVKTSELNGDFIEIEEDDTETRKKAFKSYCEYKHRMDTLKIRNNAEDQDEIKKIEQRLQRGLFCCSNRNSKFRKIFELFSRDHAEYLEKRRLLSLYSTLWGNEDWNIVDRNNISRPPKDTIAKVDIDSKIKEYGKNRKKAPTPIFKKIESIIVQKKELQKKDEGDKRFLAALTKPYSELDPSDRLDLYEGD